MNSVHRFDIGNGAKVRPGIKLKCASQSASHFREEAIII
jgi:hypothetical protein